jgi:hypothetical protein
MFGIKSSCAMHQYLVNINMPPLKIEARPRLAKLP